MTTIVAIKTPQAICLAADSRVSWGNDTQPDSNLISRKIIRWGDVRIGAAGSGTVNELLSQWLESIGPTELRTPAEVFRLFQQFWKHARKSGSVVRDQRSSSEDQLADLDAEWIVASPHGLFYVGEDLSVERMERYAAVGSGRKYALGAIEALLFWDPGILAETVARLAVRMAALFDVHTGGAIYCDSVGQAVVFVPPLARPEDHEYALSHCWEYEETGAYAGEYSRGPVGRIRYYVPDSKPRTNARWLWCVDGCATFCGGCPTLREAVDAAEAKTASAHQGWANEDKN